MITNTPYYIFWMITHTVYQYYWLNRFRSLSFLECQFVDGGAVKGFSLLSPIRFASLCGWLEVDSAERQRKEEHSTTGKEHGQVEEGIGGICRPPVLYGVAPAWNADLLFGFTFRDLVRFSSHLTDFFTHYTRKSHTQPKGTR